MGLDSSAVEPEGKRNRGQLGLKNQVQHLSAGNSGKTGRTEKRVREESRKTGSEKPGQRKNRVRSKTGSENN